MMIVRLEEKEQEPQGIPLCRCHGRIQGGRAYPVQHCFVSILCRKIKGITHMTAPRVILRSSSGIFSDRLLEMVAALPSRIFRIANSPLLPPLRPRADRMTACPASHASSCIISESSCPYAKHTRAIMRLNKSSATRVSLTRKSRNSHNGSKHCAHL